MDSPEGLEILRHSAAHIMAEAVKRLYPGTRLAIGPTIENGFYYDFDAPETFSAEDLVRIEAEMEKIIEENQEFVHWKLDREDAIREFTKQGEEYKVELLEDMEDATGASIGRVNCRFVPGPHIPSTGKLKAFKL